MAAEDTQIGGTHYATKKVQPWHAMEAWMTRDQFAGFLRGNAIKYLARCDDKGGVEDLKKARHYLDKLIEFHECSNVMCTPNGVQSVSRHATIHLNNQWVACHIPSYTPLPPASPSSSSPKLLDRVRDRIRRLGYVKRTEQSYVHWIKRFILHHGKRHPAEMGKEEVEAFLTSLAVERNVAASTQNLALSAILFL